ncbi:hypothetical protein GCM10022235_14270 [Kribbella ginsengisoli]|uniref:Uncharacterized protein n=1 Tax=Kribbella ginsengisoli TaxID=363865 RepID=A0ABP6W9K3_9ACTN
MRAALFAVVCVLLTALGHVLMSGASLPWWAIGGAFAGVWSCGWRLAACERDVVSVTAIAVAVQAVLHVGFTIAEMVGSAGAAHPQMVMPDATPVAHHHGMAHAHEMAHVQGMGHGGGLVLGSMLGMFAAHLVVALLSGLWLAYGERAVFRIVRYAAQRVRASLALVDKVSAPLGLPRIKPGLVFRVRTMRRLRLVHAIVSRGPPAGVAVG